MDMQHSFCIDTHYNLLDPKLLMSSISIKCGYFNQASGNIEFGSCLENYFYECQEKGNLYEPHWFLHSQVLDMIGHLIDALSIYRSIYLSSELVERTYYYISNKAFKLLNLHLSESL